MQYVKQQVKTHLLNAIQKNTEIPLPEKCGKLRNTLPDALEKGMKKQNKIFICSVMAAIGAMTAVPAAASAAENDKAMISEWYTDENGRIFYYDSNGEYVTGTQIIDGQYYLFSENGVEKTGWRTVNGNRCYFDSETGKPVYGWLEYCGRQYYIAPEAGKAVGRFTDAEGGLYLADVHGSVLSENGFVNYEGDCYYINESGMVQTEPTEINGVTYNFSDDGVVVTGWLENGEDKYYVYSDGSLAKGIIALNGMNYAFGEDGKLLYGLQTIDGQTVYAGADGSLATGLIAIGDSVYCFDENCFMVTGLREIADGVFYYFGEDGSAQAGWQNIGEDKYYFGDGFKMFTGIKSVDGKIYYFGEDGKMQTGRLIVDGNKYYFGEDGSAATGLVTIDNGKYYFNEEGVMQTGWQTIDGNKYYFSENGNALTNWQIIDGKKYYFNEECIMLTGRQIIRTFKYYIDENGVVQTGFITLDDGKYYFNADGKMQFGWQTIDGKQYYFDKTSGKMATSGRVDGYNIGPDGVAVPMSDVQKKAASVIASIGKNPDNIYEYVIANNMYKFIESTKSLAQIQTIGWSFFANYAMNNRFVVCYYFAAVTDLYFQEAGLESRVVYGTGRGDGDHYWNQVYINGVWTNYDTCNHYKNVTDAYLKAMNYTWKQIVYPNFN